MEAVLERPKPLLLQPLPIFAVTLYCATLLADILFPQFSQLLGLSLARGAGFLLLGSLAFSQFRPAPGIVFFSLWFVMQACHALLFDDSANFNYTSWYLIAYPQLLVSYQIIFQSLRDEKALNLSLNAYVLTCSCVLFSFLLFGIQLDYNGRLSFPDANIDANSLSFYLAVGIAICAFRILSQRKNRLFWGLCSFAFFVPLVMSGSRGGIVSLAIGVGAIAFLRSRQKLLVILWSALFLVLSVGVAIAFKLFRYAEMFSHLSQRDTIWKAAFHLFRDNFFFGTGPGQAPYEMFQKYWFVFDPSLYIKMSGRVDTHSTIFHILAESGFFGALLMTSAFGWISFKAGRNFFRKTKYSTLAVMLIIQAAVASASNTTLYDKPFWLCVSLVAVINYLSDQEWRTHAAYSPTSY